MHLKHCSSDHNTSRDLEFDKNVPRLVTTGAINLKKKQSEGNTLLCYESLPLLYKYPMLKSFNSLLVQEFTVSVQGTTSWQIFFPAHCTCVNFFGDDVLVQKCFFLRILACRIFFFKITLPP